MRCFGVRRAVASPDVEMSEKGSRAFEAAGEESSTRPGARRLSFSLLFGEAETGGDVRDVAPTIRRERRGELCVRDKRWSCSARFRIPEASLSLVLFSGSGRSIG